MIDTEAFGQEGIISSYLVKGRDKVALIDPGFPSSAEIIKSKLINNGIDPARIDYILLTHFHLDHTGGTGAFVKDSNAKVITHKRGAFYVKNFGKIAGGARMVFGHEFSKRFGEYFTVPPDRVIAIDDGDVIDLGGGVKIRAIHTPGHTTDQVSYLEEQSGIIFTGDAAGLAYPALNGACIPAGSPPIYDLEAQCASLNKIKSIKPDALMLPHFGRFNGDYQAFAEKNIEAVHKTKEKIIDMFNDGLEFNQMVEHLRLSIIRESNKPESEIPLFISNTWLTMMLKTGLMGYMAYLLQYAPYPRAYEENIAKPELAGASA